MPATSGAVPHGEKVNRDFLELDRNGCFPNLKNVG